MKHNGSNRGKYEAKYVSPRRRRRSTKALLSLCLILVLGVCLTIGGTLAFLQKETGVVTNTFQAGDITYKLNLVANADGVDMPTKLDAKQSTALSVDFAADKAPSKTGYTFGGWYYDADCTEAYPGDQISRNTITVKYGDSHDSDDAANKVEITLYARWTPNGYEVAYDGNGTTEVAMNNSKHTYDVAQDLSANTYVKTGYTFTGWNTKADGTGDAYTDQQSVINLTEADGGIVTLYAQWKANGYTIHYDANTGSGTMEDTSAVYDQDVILRENAFTKTGYIFTGWNIKADGSGDAYADKTTVKNLATSGTVTLYAQWEPITYTVKYHENGGTGTTADSTHTYDVAKELTKNGFTWTGHDFLGWSTDPNATDATYSDKESVVNLTDVNGATVDLYAVWKSNIYKVSFDVNTTDNVTKPADQQVIYGEAYGTLPTVTRDLYKFTGWTLTKDGDDYVTKDTIVSIAKDHTLYAKWVGSHEYTITYYANSSNASFTGGKQQVTDTKVQDASYTIKTPTELGVSRNGYVWTQWNTEPDGTGKSYLGGANYSTNSDLTLYAIWATKTAVTFGEPDFVNMKDTSKTEGTDAYNFTLKCKTQSGADGIAIPIYNLIPGEAYRLTFSVTFNDFKFYRDDDGDATNKESTNGSYIFGTNIIDQYKNYDTKLSIISQSGEKTTSKYENMQWSTTESGRYEVYLDFVPNASTMYWFWETTDIVDHQEMSYVFNNFNIQNFGPSGPRVEFEDLTVTFQTAPTNSNSNGGFSSSNTTSLYTWPNNTNSQTVRHKNYFHTESFGTNYLNYRVFGYVGHERMTIPITGLTVGQWYELSFTQDLSGAVRYDNNRTDQLYGCAVSATSTTSDNFGSPGCVDTMSGYQDLRYTTVKNTTYSTSIKFQATASTMYWHWTLGDLKDYHWSDVSLSNVTLKTTDAPATLEEPIEEETTGITFDWYGIDSTNMDWYPVDEQMPVAGESYALAFEPHDGYSLPETITVIIDDVTYTVYTDGEDHREIPEGQTAADLPVMPTFDPDEGILTIPAELLTDTTSVVTVNATAVELAVTVPTETATVPTEGATVPTETVTDPTEAATNPTEAATDPTEAATEPTAAATEPATESTEPTAAATEPTVAATDPTEAATEATEVTNPTDTTEKEAE